MDPAVVQKILEGVSDEPVVLVGGQAVLVWAELYRTAPEFVGHTPPPTKDIDFVGTKASAKRLAALLGGKCDVPPLDDTSPNTAVVTIQEGADSERIDFLDYIKGPGDAVLAGAIELSAFAYGFSAPVKVKVMHPLHCLQSKLANRSELGRSGPGATEQLEATVPVLREFISEVLSDPETRSVAYDAMAKLARYLEKDSNGRRAHLEMQRDPLSVLQHFANDPRADERFRANNLARAIERVQSVRTRQIRTNAKGPRMSEASSPWPPNLGKEIER